jgi:serine protease Do
MKGRTGAVAVGLMLTLAGCRKSREEPAPAPAAPAAEAPSPTGDKAPALPQAMPPDMSAALASIAPLVESVKAAVVYVEVRGATASRGADEGTPRGDDFGGQPWGPFNPFGGGPAPREERPRQGLGSGFIIDARGLVLTNHHVVEDAREIRVQLPGGRQLDARVLGTDPLTDVALLQLTGEDVKELPTVKLGDSEALRVGDWVVAIGNPFGLESSVSLGIVSAKARELQVGPFDEFLQTDAAINPGNSGGPLFNMKGEVVGINTAIIGQGSGIGFAVPSRLVQSLLPQLEKEGAVTRGWMGVAVQDLTADLGTALGLPVREGAIVTEVTEGTPAAEAGLQVDDVITAVGEQAIGSGRSLTRTVALKPPGTALPLTVYRGGKPREIHVTLGTRPDLEGVAARARPEVQEEPPHERVGLGVSDMTPRMARAQGLPATGALVTDVAPGSSAERAGLAPGMVVVEAQGRPVRRAGDLARLLGEAAPGQPVLLRVVSPGGGRALLALTVPQQ